MKCDYSLARDCKIILCDTTVLVSVGSNIHIQRARWLLGQLLPSGVTACCVGHPLSESLKSVLLAVRDRECSVLQIMANRTLRVKKRD